MATIGELLRLILPDLISEDRSQISPPSFPPDMFGVSAYLLQQSGAYHRVVPGPIPGYSTDGLLVIDQNLISDCRETALQWSKSPFIPDRVKQLWNKLLAAQNDEVHIELHSTSKHPAWWIYAYSLMVISDEACEDVGYRPSNKGTWIESVVDVAIAKANQRSKSLLGHQRKWNHLYTITLYANQDIFCVQPKARTPDVGCALRSISHNLGHRLIKPHPDADGRKFH
ncbi:MAG: hypothetical protein ABL893_09065, partial [Hyphomicrobium sp.]